MTEEAQSTSKEGCVPGFLPPSENGCDIYEIYREVRLRPSSLASPPPYSLDALIAVKQEPRNTISVGGCRSTHSVR